MKILTVVVGSFIEEDCCVWIDKGVLGELKGEVFLNVNVCVFEHLVELPLKTVIGREVDRLFKCNELAGIWETYFFYDSVVQTVF